MELLIIKGNIMPLFIARDYDGNVESIVLAKNRELATAFWQGQKIYAHSVDEKTEELLNDHPSGVMPILYTKKKKVRYLSDDAEIRIVYND